MTRRWRVPRITCSAPIRAWHSSGATRSGRGAGGCAENSGLAEDAVKLLVVMSVIDAPLDRGKLDLVLQYAQRLGVEERYLQELAEAAEQRMQEALADMTRANMESILNQPWAGGDVLAWLLPYQGDAGDPALAARFQGLRRLGGNTFGHAFWRHFTDSGYTFPGEATALNAAFSVPR